LLLVLTHKSTDRCRYLEFLPAQNEFPAFGRAKICSGVIFHLSRKAFMIPVILSGIISTQNVIF
jgi:hypothetical protein